MKAYRLLVICAGLAIGAAVAADIEVTGPDGRKILLKADKTWSYAESKEAKDIDKDKAADAKPKDPGEAVLSPESKIDGPRICRYQLKLVNNLPYEIRSLVPELSVFRTQDVVYDSKFAGFSFIRPGDTQTQEVRFNGIGCEEVLRVRVGGGDRCEMGELDKFSNAKGKCLALVRVVESKVVRFDK